LTNPDFASGVFSQYLVYDNNATGHITLSTIADATVPNASGYKMQIAVSAGGESPGLGGFTVAIGPDGGTFSVNTYHKGSTIIWRILANIPVGHNIQWGSNATGNEATTQWLTPQAGTGGWFTYVFKQVIGVTGSFGSTGFFYLDGAFSSAFNWYVGKCSAVCLDLPASISVNYHPRVQYFDVNTGQSPTSTVLNPQNSILPGQTVAFTLSEPSPTELDQSWGTQTLKRPDGSTLTLTSGSHSFTSLTANTTYYFYPYLTVSGSSAIMNWLGPYTTPTAAEAMDAYLDGRFSLGALHDHTPSSGTGGGGSSDPGGSCPHEDEMVWVKRGGADPVRMRCVEVLIGDLIKGYSFLTNADIWREVKSLRHQPGTMWYRTKGYLCTPCETVYVNNTWMAAYKVPGASKVRGKHGRRVELRVDSELPLEERNYWLDNGADAPLLMHNFIPYC
jgi:hypothetical protein